MKRCREREAENERMSDKELMRHISEIDKRRAQSYSFYTDKGLVKTHKIWACLFILAEEPEKKDESEENLK